MLSSLKEGNYICISKKQEESSYCKRKDNGKGINRIIRDKWNSMKVYYSDVGTIFLLLLSIRKSRTCIYGSKANAPLTNKMIK